MAKFRSKYSLPTDAHLIASQRQADRFVVGALMFSCEKLIGHNCVLCFLLCWKTFYFCICFLSFALFALLVSNSFRFSLLFASLCTNISIFYSLFCRFALVYFFFFILLLLLFCWVSANLQFNFELMIWICLFVYFFSFLFFCNQS